MERENNAYLLAPFERRTLQMVCGGLLVRIVVGSLSFRVGLFLGSSPMAPSNNGAPSPTSRRAQCATLSSALEPFVAS